jgi:hypothetical protein
LYLGIDVKRGDIVKKGIGLKTFLFYPLAISYLGASELL